MVFRRAPATGLSAPGSAKRRLQDACLGLLRGHEQRDEIPTSARFLFYELKQAGYPLAARGARRPDQDVIDAVKLLRDAGLVPWEWLADETRSVEGAHLAGSVRQWVLDMLGQARERLRQRLHEFGPESSSGPRFELTEIQLQPNDGEARVVRWADIDGTIEDSHGLLRCNCCVPSR